MRYRNARKSSALASKIFGNLTSLNLLDGGGVCGFCVDNIDDHKLSQ